MEINNKSKLKNQVPPIIDNRTCEDGKTLYEYFKDNITMDVVLKFIFSNCNINKAKICTGFFSPHVWKLVGECFGKIPISKNGKSFQLLIGSEEKNKSLEDLQRFFDEELHKELEELDLDIKLQKHIKSLIEFLQRDDIEVALQGTPFVHGKLYWFPEIAIVGSSNFTVQGFLRNTELNVPIFELNQIEALSSWFDTIFKKADKTYKKKLIDALKNCKLGTTEWTPFDVYMKILYEVYKPTLSLDNIKSTIDIQLTMYQQEGVTRIIKAIEDFGGAMLADSVGLGKSYQGLEAIRRLQVKHGKRQALIICPAQLKRNWENMVAISDVWAQVYSMETLAKKLPKKKNFDMIVIDESHNFRNKRTKRYKQLELLLARNPDSSVLLMTATPINTSMKDLLAQMLIISKSSVSYKPFHYIGIYDLEEYFKSISKNHDEIAKLRDHVIISRSRREIRLRQKLFNIDLTINGEPLKFPERRLESIYYNITDTSLSGISSNQFYEKMVELLDNLEFPYYNLEKYNIEESDDSAIQIGKNISSLMKVLLLKRLESSIVVFDKSIRDQIKLSHFFKESIKKNFFLTSSQIREIINDIQAEVQDEGNDEIEYFLNFLEDKDKLKDFLEGEEQSSTKFDISKIDLDIKKDEQTLIEIQKIIQKILSHNDEKLESLFEKINQLQDQKILIFSYFKDTVDYVYDNLIKKFPERKSKFAKITGETETEKRNNLIKRFAPLSNPSDEEEELIQNPEEELQLLISTDVLSEGQNLQDASICINYDLHWNPVRIIQRIGRIDRLKSPHKEISVYNIFPEEGLETLLKLVSRLVERLKIIDQTIELDGAVLTGEELEKRTTQINRLKNEDISVLDELESEAELLVDDEVREILLKTIFAKADSWFKERPIGIHSGIQKEDTQSGVAIVIKIMRRGIPSFLWGFEPDDPDSFKDYLKNGIITSKSMVQKMIACEESHLRYLPENENINGELFTRVMQIAFKLKQLFAAREITNKLEDQIPKGNKIYIQHIKFAQRLALKMPVKFPDVNKIMKFLNRTKISIISSELDDLPKFYKEQIEIFDNSKQITKTKEKEQIKKDFVNNTIDFIVQVTDYIEKNKLIGEEIVKSDSIEKFELIGFLRIYRK